MRVVVSDDRVRDIEVATRLEANRQCKLRAYNSTEVPELQLKAEFITYASPDSTYAVTKQLLDQAQRSIVIGIYDFDAKHIRDILLKAVQRGVTVTIMLDLDGRKGEPETWEELIQGGCEGVPAPSCASKRVRYFASSHEKVIVIDDEWTLVQSGNYTNNSIPKNAADGVLPADPKLFVPGNRDMGVAIRSEVLATYLAGILRSDMQLELDGERRGQQMPAEGVAERVVLTAARPSKPPPKLFPSRRFNPRKPVRVLPVLSPDNYMQVIPGFLASATKSILIEQQYIRATQPEIRKLLEAIHTAMANNPGIDVRIVLGRPRDLDQELVALEEMERFGLRLGKHIRYINPRYLVHCHNKLIIVDRASVLVSSQNWSDPAVAKNREGGLLLRYPAIARYYASLFNVDWRTGLRTLRRTGLPHGLSSIPPGVPAMPDTIEVSLGDYLEV
jgi:phosphatidylserine/phosphatidylglycerophosphate/cardiolipin synthase-like enzyme